MKRLALALLLLGALPACKDSGTSEPPVQAPAPPEPPVAEVPSAAHDAAAEPERIVLPPPPPVPGEPLGLPDTPSPDHNRTTPAKVALGELLFFDGRLGADGATTCATCHQPDHGWAAPEPRSPTAAGKPNLRHTPTLVNIAYAHEYFWDGRMDGLEATILSHWKGQLGVEPTEAARRLADHPVYAAHFERAFGGPPTRDAASEALAAFVRTIRSGDAPWDRYERGDGDAVGPEVIAGFRVFSDAAQCALCHPPPLYTDFGYHDLGIGKGRAPRDDGRARVTGRAEHRNAFKTPTLRGAVHNPPYFHDGSAATLEQAVDLVLASGHATAPGVQLTAEQRRNLLAFLRSLSPAPTPYRAPTVPR